MEDKEESGIQETTGKLSRRDLLRLTVGAAAAKILGFGGAGQAQAGGIETSKKEKETKTQKVIVSLIGQEGKDSPKTKEELEEILQEAGEFYKENSYGKLQFNFVVTDWAHVRLPAGLLDLEPISHLGDDILKNEGKFDQEAMRIYMVDRRNIDYRAGGYAVATGPSAKLFIGIDEHSAISTLVKHELGHALGFDHVRLAISNELHNYTDNLYFDSSNKGTADIMGSGHGHISAPSKLLVEWIAPEQVKVVDKPTEVVISPLELPTQGTQVVKIKKPDTNEFYFIELRRPIGFDTAKGQTFNSTTVRSGLRYYMGNPSIGTELVEVLAGKDISYILNDKIFEPFYDKVNGIKITPIADEDDGMRIRIDFVEPITLRKEVI